MIDGMKATDLDRVGADWLEKIEAAEKREQRWLNDAREAEAAYMADEEQSEGGLPEFNILHSNVETIVPSIINSSPAPDIRPKDSARRGDPLAALVANVYDSAVKSQMDDDALLEEVEANAQDAFMAGRGVVRVRFDAEFEEAMTIDPMTGEQVPTGEMRATGEKVLYEVVAWGDFRQGSAKRWKDVPWVAFRHEVSETQRQKLEDEAIREAYDRDGTEDRVDETRDKTIWEIWCKETARVYFVVEESHKVLSIKEDPLEMPGFFPCAKPIQPIKATKDMTPVCPYAVYMTLAKELDRITKRINGIMKGLKVRGAFLGDATIAEAMSGLDDWEVAPIPNIENLAAVGGLDKAVMWWPIEQAIKVLRELYIQRDQTKQAIYEITGISDIVRGASAASETATAQQIKTEWGSLRIKKMQRLIEREVRELIVMTVQIMARHFTTQRLMEITRQEIPAEAEELLRAPLDNYRVDVETDSTIRADLTKSRSEMSEFLRGTSEFFATMAPVVQSAPEAAGPLAKMYAAFAQQFNLGKAAEDALDQFVQLAEKAAKDAQANPKVDPEAERQKAEAEMRGQELQLKMRELEAKLRLEAEKQQTERDGHVADRQIKMIELAIKRQELEMKGAETQLKEAEAEVKAAAAFVQATEPPNESDSKERAN